MLAPNIERLDSGTGFQYPVAALFEDHLRQITQHRLIFDHQNSLLAPPHPCDSRRLGLPDSDRLRARREIKSERATCSNLAGDFNPALMLFDDAVHGGQTEARTFAHFFRSEEWFEDA